MAWGGYVGTAGYPMGCQIGRLMRHETPLARPWDLPRDLASELPRIFAETLGAWASAQPRARVEGHFSAQTVAGPAAGPGAGAGAAPTA